MSPVLKDYNVRLLRCVASAFVHALCALRVPQVDAEGE